MLKYGWTTIRICGDADVEYGVISLKRAIKEKIFVGPRIFGAAHYISSTGGGGDFLLSNENNCIHPDDKNSNDRWSYCVIIVYINFVINILSSFFLEYDSFYIRMKKKRLIKCNLIILLILPQRIDY